MGVIEDKNFMSGLFNISPDRKLSGTILLDGPESILHLWSDSKFNIDASESDTTTITGILEDQKKVSLIGCVREGESDYFGSDGVSHHKKFYPHYVAIGPRYFQNSDKVISNISILVDDAETLFHDRQAFGTALVPPEKFDELTKLDIFRNIIFTNDYLHIGYYTGKSKIFSANTVLGKISAWHRTTFGMGGPSGVRMDNKIYVNISFNEPLSVTQLFNPISTVLRFFEVVVGRPQNLLEIEAWHNQKDSEITDPSSVYIPMFPNRNKHYENRAPDFVTFSLTVAGLASSAICYVDG